MKAKLIEAAIGCVILSGGIVATAAIAPAILVTAPLATYDTAMRIKHYRGYDDLGFKPSAPDIALMVTAEMLEGVKRALDPIKGTMDIALLGAATIARAYSA